MTSNDTGDADTGANNLQNFPVLSSAVRGTGGTTVNGTLNSKANQSFRIEFFTSPTADPSGFGEGKVFLGVVVVTTNRSGNASFTVTLAGVPAGSQVITATATDSATTPRNSPAQSPSRVETTSTRGATSDVDALAPSPDQEGSETQKKKALP